MQTLTFTYTKADGSSSERTLLAMVTPTDKYAGVDMTMMEPNDAAMFAKMAKKLHDEYLDDLRVLQQSFDLRYNYRQFNESGVSNLVKI